jgi:hypothetical protein
MLQTTEQTEQRSEINTVLNTNVTVVPCRRTHYTLSETSITPYQTTRHYMPEHISLQTWLVFHRVFKHISGTAGSFLARAMS